MKKLVIHNTADDTTYPVWIGSEFLEKSFGDFLALQRRQGKTPGKVVLISDETVFEHYGDELSQSIAKSGFDRLSWLMPVGEEHKNFEQLENALMFLSDQRLSRTDIIVSLGGGVVGDLAGLASSLYMRGIGIFQIPTTLLSMVDSSVGGKTAINLPNGKNLVGTFYPPLAVAADIGVLKTLEIREVKAGFYELIKHGAIGGMELLEQTRAFLEKYPLSKFPDYFSSPDFLESLIDIVFAQIQQKARFVEGDPSENPLRSDEKSRKILNFGHTIAHALEKATDYRYFRHGEAVGWGMLTALNIARRLDICEENSINLLNDVVRSVGGLPDTSHIDIDLVCSALELDKKRSQDSLHWVLLKRIGSPCIVNGDSIPNSIVRDSLSSVLLE